MDRSLVRRYDDDRPSRLEPYLRISSEEHLVHRHKRKHSRSWSPSRHSATTTGRRHSDSHHAHRSASTRPFNCYDALSKVAPESSEMKTAVHSSASLMAPLAGAGLAPSPLPASFPFNSPPMPELSPTSNCSSPSDQQQQPPVTPLANSSAFVQRQSVEIQHYVVALERLGARVTSSEAEGALKTARCLALEQERDQEIRHRIDAEIKLTLLLAEVERTNGLQKRLELMAVLDVVDKAASQEV